MFGWFSFASSCASRSKRPGECRIGRERLREQLQRGQAIQLRLPHFENHAHAALTNDLEHFEFGKGEVTSSSAGAFIAAACERFVGAATPRSTHAGQRPPGASGGMGDWQRGQIFCMAPVS
jgi:hypothetical protein